MAKKRIMLDPGHYGPKYNAGAVSGYYESAIVYKLTMYEKEYLENMGIEVGLTRTNINENPELTYRGQKAEGYDLFVSNHTNACGTPSVDRAVVIHLVNNATTDIDERSKAFAFMMAEILQNTMPITSYQVYSKLSDADRDKNGKLDDNYYGVLHGSYLAGVPGVIVEHSFHTNADICRWLMNDDNLKTLAKECAKCMASYLGVNETVEEPKKDTTLLTATMFKGATREEVIEATGYLFTEDHKQSGILACVSAAQFILESGGLQSELAQNGNNCFGMKENLSGNTWDGSVWDGSVYTKETSEWVNNEYIMVKANFRAYPSIKESVADHSAYLLGAMNGDKKRYAGLKGCTDPRTALQIIKDGGYATSPDYVDKLMNVIEKYDLQKLDYVSKENKTESAYPAVPFRVEVIIDDLNYRSEPSMDGKVLGQTKKGIFTIVEISNGWGKLKSGIGWIWLGNAMYCRIKETVSDLPYVVKVDIDDLNIRTGPGIGYAKTGEKTGRGKFTITEVKEGPGSDTGWGKLKSGAGWISLDYAKRI